MAALATQVVTKCLHIWKTRTDFKERGERVRGGQRDGRMGIGLEGFTRFEGVGRNKRGGRGLEGGEGGKQGGWDGQRMAAGSSRVQPCVHIAVP